MKIKNMKKINQNFVALKLIEDEMTESENFIQVNDFYLEKNAFNEEHTHSYFARVLLAPPNNFLQSSDIVYLKKVYSRELMQDEDGVSFMMTSISNIIAKINGVDKKDLFDLKSTSCVELVPGMMMIELLKTEIEEKWRDVYLLDKSFRERQYARIIALGDGCHSNLKEGQIIYINPDIGTYIDINGKKYCIINNNFVLCLVEGVKIVD
jgi:co-chaperonin GroES (HSP10)